MIKQISVRYEFQSWSLLGEAGLSGHGSMTMRMDTLYGETIETTLRRCATLLRRNYRHLSRMEIICSHADEVKTFKFNM